MSVFSGYIREYPDIAVDRFTSEECQTFFLSHFHTDHIVGLDRLRRQVEIFCSSTTRNLLLANQKYSHLETCLTPLTIDEAHDISVKRSEDETESPHLQVTLIQAGHCLGSVMFLFGGDAGHVLYTGDFRLAVGDAARIRSLHDGLRPLPLRAVYVDTTFFSAFIKTFPSRRACSDAVLDAVAEWFEAAPHRVVHLSLSAKFTYEFLFDLLRQRFGDKVHVYPGQVQMYGSLPDVISCLTCDPSETRIHACYSPNRSGDYKLHLPCQRLIASCKPRSEVLNIRPSTIYFTNSSATLSERVSHNFLRVCFSFHSSYEEIVDFLRHLRPQRAEACVISTADETLQETQSRLDAMLAQFAKEVPNEKTPSFGKLCYTKRRRRVETDDELDDFDCGDDVCSLSEKKRKRKRKRKEAGDEDSTNRSSNSQLIFLSVPEESDPFNYSEEEEILEDKREAEEVKKKDAIDDAAPAEEKVDEKIAESRPSPASGDCGQTMGMTSSERSQERTNLFDLVLADSDDDVIVLD